MTELGPSNQCTTAMMTALRTLTMFQQIQGGLQVSYDPYNISRGADYWFWVSPYTGSTESRFAARMKLVQWSNPCQLDVRYTTEAESGNKLVVARDTITAFLSKPRLLKNINVNKVAAVFNSKPMEQTINGINFLVQQATVTIEQIVIN